MHRSNSRLLRASASVLRPVALALLLLLLFGWGRLDTEGALSNTILYPVSEDARQQAYANTAGAINGQQQQQQQQQQQRAGHDGSGGTNKQDVSEQQRSSLPPRKPGAPSRYLEYEGPDATYHIRLGIHPSIYYPDLDDFPDTEIRIRYEYNRFLQHDKHQNQQQQQQQQQQQTQQQQPNNPRSNRGEVLQVDDCPRHFLWLSDKAVKAELDYRLDTGRWSERVLVEKTYFTLFYGGTGLASRYMDSVDDFQTDLVGWEIMNRSSHHCDWEGIECESLPSPSPKSDEIKAQTETESPMRSVIGFQIHGFSLEGTLPHDLYQLSKLRAIDLHGNRIRGTIPSSWGNLSDLQTVDLRDNRLTGTLPPSLERWTDLRHLLVGNNGLAGTVPEPAVRSWARGSPGAAEDGGGGLITLDLASNEFGGKFPHRTLLHFAQSLEVLDLSHNRFVGSLPNFVIPDPGYARGSMGGSNLPGRMRAFAANCTAVVQKQLQEDQQKQQQQTQPPVGEPAKDRHHRCVHENLARALGTVPAVAGLGKLGVLDVSYNNMGGTLPDQWMVACPMLFAWNLEHNEFTGSVPRAIWQSPSLEHFKATRNFFTGEIPSGETATQGAFKNGSGGWSNLVHLKHFHVDQNQMTGTIPSDLLEGLSPSLEELFLGANRFVGEIPSAIGKMTKLERLDFHGNILTGRLPAEMNRMRPDVRLNLTDNLLVGTVPKIFCGGGGMSSNPLFREFGCDAILCPAGTFHPNGAASAYAGCRPCPVRQGDDLVLAKTLGGVRCGKNNNRTKFVHGDINGDGVLTEREVLRLLYTYTVGRNWGLQFDSWAELSVDKCDLNGVSCTGGKVTRIDLTDAAMCVTGDRKAAPANECKGIPAEISKLTHLEVLTLSRRQYLRGPLPNEIGKLTNLRYLDVSGCPMMTGALPSEIGRLTNLKYLDIAGCRFDGTIPDELFKLHKMEKLHLSINAFTGTISSSLEKMTNLKELLLSRTYVNGTIPEGIGELVALENFEMYGNQLLGTIPNSLGRCTNLKRIDLFNNKLTGTIPESLTGIKALQILHIKLNHLTGTISSGFGRLPNLSWFDVSTNHLHGTIPETFGYSETLKDFRLGGGNMIHDPVPASLCSNTNINGGLTKTYGCSGVICPVGTYSDPGHATHSDGCKRCPHGRTTIYLGSSRCVELNDEDILTMFYDVMAASSSFPMQQNHWGLNREGDVCSWNGVECDENETIESIWFPLLGLNAD